MNEENRGHALNRKDRWSLSHLVFLVFSLGFILRLLHLSNLITGPYFTAPIMDALYHDLWARRFVAGALPREPFFRAPLYPTLLGIIYRLVGRDFFIARLVGIFFGMGTGVLTYFIGRRLFGRTVGLIAAAVLMFYWPFIYYETELLIPATLIFLIFLSIQLLFMIDDKPERYTFWIGSGICFGLAAITRPNILLFIPLVVVWLFGKYRKKFGLHLLAFVIALSTVVGSVTVRNYLVGKDFVLIASQAGINFFIGNNPDADGYTAKTPLGYNWYGEYEDSVALFSVRRAEELTGRKMKPSEISSFWFRQGLDFWKQHPLDASKLLIKKSYLFWNGYEIKNNKDLYFQKRFSWVLRLPLFNFGLVSVAGLTGIGLWFVRRKTRRGAFVFSPQTLLIGYVFVYMVSVVPFFVCARYRLPVVPALAVFGAYWGTELIRGIRKKKLPFALSTIFVYVLLTILLGLDPYGVRDSNFAEEHWSAGNSYQESGRLEQSVVEYNAALKERPDYVDAWVNLGNSLFALERYEEAVTAYARTIELDPSYGKAYNNLAQLYLVSGETEKALEPALKAVEAARRNAVFRNTLGEVYLALRRYDEAEEEFRTSVDLFPGYIRAYKNLAALATAMNQPERARDYLKEVLRLDPNDMEAEKALSGL